MRKLLEMMLITSSTQKTHDEVQKHNEDSECSPECNVYEIEEIQQQCQSSAEMGVTLIAMYDGDNSIEWRDSTEMIIVAIAVRYQSQEGSM